ncbi:MAG: GNAT family N-acetyltransferase [Geminicoccales bacterium]
MVPRVDVVRIRFPEQLGHALAIRRAVFVAEQGVSEALEFDGRDSEAEHLLALLDGEPVGTLRLRLLDNGRIARIERVAVLAQARGRRTGQALMRSALERAIALDAREARLHAQTYVTAFYQALGFVPFGEEFEEDGIPHVAMRLDLARTDPQPPEAT